MSEENNQNNAPEGQEGAPDPLLNLKSEISRKLQNSESKMSELVKQNQMLAESLKTISARLAPQPKASEDDDLESLAYSDPKKYAAKVAHMATETAMRATTEVNNLNAQKNNVLNTLMQDYPELSNTSSDLTKTAVEIYNSLSDSEKASPSSYKLAVREAAAQLGVLPASKRKESSRDSDDFVAPGSRGNTSGGRSSQSRGKEEIDPKILAISELFGRDVSDPKVRERLKKHSQRSKWNRYE